MTAFITEDHSVMNRHSALVSMNVVQVLSIVTSGAIGVHQHPITTAGSTGTAIMVGMGVVALIVDTEIWPSTAAAPTHPVRALEHPRWKTTKMAT
jgi:hypothetical protein